MNYPSTLENRAICWLDGETKEVTILEGLGIGSGSAAEKVSGDGNVIVGESSDPDDPNIWHAVRWKRNTGTKTFNITDINFRPTILKDTWIASAHGVNYDGTVIVGACFYETQSGGQIEAFIWQGECNTQSSETRRPQRKVLIQRAL